MKRNLKWLALALALVLALCACAAAEGIAPPDPEGYDPAGEGMAEDALTESIDGEPEEIVEVEAIDETAAQEPWETEVVFDGDPEAESDGDSEGESAESDGIVEVEASDEEALAEAPAAEREAIEPETEPEADATVGAAETPAEGTPAPNQPADAATTDGAFDGAEKRMEAGNAEAGAPIFTGNARRVPVLTYHKVLTDEEKQSARYAKDRYSVSLSNFTRQMNWLKERQYTAITCEELYMWHNGLINLPRKSVLITFDDGYASTIENVLPVLEVCQLKGTAFIIGSETATSNGTIFITADRMREIREQCPWFEFQSHTWNLHRKSAYKTEKYAAFAADAVQQRDTYGFEYIAYPYGKNSKAMRRAYRDNGLKMAFLFGSSHNGYATRKQGLFKMKRIEVTGSMSFKRFKRWCK